MTLPTISSREFNRSSAAIREESLKHPILITVRGIPSNVLMSYDLYKQAFPQGKTKKKASDLFGCKEIAHIDIDGKINRSKELVRAAEFD